MEVMQPFVKKNRDKMILYLDELSVSFFSLFNKYKIFYVLAL